MDMGGSARSKNAGQERSTMPGTGRDLMEVLENLPDAMTLSTAVRDENGRAVDMRLEFMNAKARRGQPDPESAVGRLCSELWPGMIANGSFDQCMHVLDTGEPIEGSFEWTEDVTYRPAGYDYRAVRVGQDTLVWVLRDNTERLQAQWELAASERRYRAVLSALEEGVTFTSADREVLAANEAAERILGLTLEQLTGRAPVPSQWQLLDEDMRPLGQRIVATELALETGRPVGSLVNGVRKHDGSLVWVSQNAAPLFHPEADEPYAVVTSFADITAEREAREALKALALHDSLTGLANRVLLKDRIGQALARARRRSDGGGVVLFFLDLDGFKPINDSRGHAVGDEVLRRVGERLTHATRPQDTVARVGGDEFVVLCEELPRAGIEAMIERFDEAVSRPISVGGGIEERVGVSIGYAVTGPQSDAESLLETADAAMYEVKRGRSDARLTV